jgi:DNA-binding transcriptional MerR regulator
MSKSPDAFRTISEVAEWLGIPAHVLRFWESKFTQIKPVKRAGGRRYYRPADMMLLGGIKRLLHDNGMSIKEVQALLRDQGIAHVAEKSASLDETADPMPVIEAEGTVTDFPAQPQLASAHAQMQMNLDSQSGSNSEQLTDTSDIKPEPEAFQPEPEALQPEPEVELPTETVSKPDPKPLLESDSPVPVPDETPETSGDGPTTEATVGLESETAAGAATARPKVIEIDDAADDALNITHAGVLSRLATITTLPPSALSEALVCAEQLRSIATSQSNPTAN